jgi:YD repeat-containing protein
MMRRPAIYSLTVIAAALLTNGYALAQISPPPLTNIVYSYQYDNNDNLTQATDALSHVTKITYDALNRRSQVTDANKGNTIYGYDPLDHLISVTDPRSLVTSYQIDGFNNLNQLQSPDTGNTINTYDPNGNLLTRIDAKQQTTRYSYDVLNRVTRITYNDNSTVAYTYDQGTNGVGHLTQIVDASGTIQYAYDTGGRLLTETHIVNVVTAPNGTPTPTTYVTSYAYDSDGRLSSMTYPSGRVLTYTRDALGRINQIVSLYNGVSVTLVSNVQYLPFGGVASYTNSAGKSYTRSFDQSGRITSYTLNGQANSLVYDGASNITSYTDSIATTNSSTYGYDPLNRLTSAVTSTSGLSYAYDPNGNRTSQTNGGASATLTYAANSNQLTQIVGAQTTPIAIDANGSITNNGLNQFGYDARGRMISANSTTAGQVQFTLNPLGQRIQKVTSAGGIVFEYDSSGKLIGEISGQHGKDYIYLGDIPVVVAQM